MKDSSRALFCVHLILNLHQVEFEKPHVDDVTRVLPNLDAITYTERTPPDDGEPSGDPRYDIFQGIAKPTVKRPRKVAKD